MRESHFRVNGPGVIGEVLDGEAIIVNLDSGAYYSLDGVGAVVWTAAQAGATLAGAITLVTDRYTGESQQIAADVTALIEELLGEGLLTESDAPAAESAPAAALLPADRPQFIKPVLQKYTDMADLLLLDPIHEVDEQGWPHPAPRA